jgi:anthranilate phosphoribosyltransferase
VAGSGKKGVKTINISTPATIVAASCGTQIVKPCSRSTSSLTGSSDFFTYLGGEFKNTEETCRDFYKTNIGFFSIEGLIPKFDAIYGGKALTPTALSYALPAMINPIKTNSILYGLSLPNIKTSIHSLHELGYDNVVVANTSDDNKKFVDEIGLFRYNNLVHGRNSEDYDEVIVGDPAKMLKLKSRYAIDSILQKESITQNIKASVDVLKGKGEDVHKEIIAVNAGSIMYLANLVENFREGYLLALKEIYTGRPFDKLQEIVTTSGGTLSNV